MEIEKKVPSTSATNVEETMEVLMEEVGHEQDILADNVLGREAALSLLGLATDITSAAREVDESTAKAMALNLETTATTFRMIDKEVVTVAVEVDGSTLGVIGATGEGASALLATAWKQLMRIVASAKAGIAKLYTATMSKIRGFDKRFEALEKGLGELKETKMGDIKLDVKALTSIRSNNASLFMGGADVELTSALVASLQYSDHASKSVFTVLSVIVNFFKSGKGFGFEHEAVFNTFKEKAPKIPKQFGFDAFKANLPTNSKILAYMRKSGSNNYILPIRLTGKTIVVLGVALINGKVSVTTIKDSASPVFIKKLREATDKAKLPEPKVVAAYVKTMKDIKLEGGPESINKVSEMVTGLDKVIADSKDKSVSEVQAMSEAKTLLTQLSSVTVAFSRETMYHAYNSKLNFLVSTENLLKEYKAVSKKEEKAGGEHEEITIDVA